MRKKLVKSTSDLKRRIVKKQQGGNLFASYLQVDEPSIQYNNSWIPVNDIFSEYNLPTRSQNNIPGRYIMPTRSQNEIPVPVKEIKKEKPVTFVNELRPVIADTLKRKGLDSKWVDHLVAQAALESNWGKSESGKFNLSGIKGNGTERNTKEFIDGKMTNTKDSFRDFKDYNDWADYYINLLSNKRYGKAFNMSEQEFMPYIINAGYATDPNYISKYNKVLNEVKKYQEGGTITKKDLNTIDSMYMANKNIPFINRILNKSPLYITDWENPVDYATHKLSWSDADNKAYIYPEVQQTNNTLKDYTRIPYNRFAGFNEAAKNKNMIKATPQEANLFTKHYKESKYFKDYQSNLKPYRDETLKYILRPKEDAPKVSSNTPSKDSKEYIADWLGKRTEILGANARKPAYSISKGIRNSFYSNLELGEEEKTNQLSRLKRTREYSISGDTDIPAIPESGLDRKTIENIYKNRVDVPSDYKPTSFDLESLRALLEGVHSPSKNIIFYPRNPSKSTIVHEQTHALNAYPQEVSIYKLKGKKYLQDKVLKDNYLDSNTEIYSRLMQLRHDNNISPYFIWNKEDVKKLRSSGKDADILNRYTDDYIVRLLNEVASNNDGSSKTNFIRNGGRIQRFQNGKPIKQTQAERAYNFTNPADGFIAAPYYSTLPVYSLLGTHIPPRPKDDMATPVEEAYWKHYLRLGRDKTLIPDTKSKINWDKENGANSDYVGVPQPVARRVQALADTLNTGKIVRNYQVYKKKYPELPEESAMNKIYKFGKQLLDTGKAQQANEDMTIKDINRDVAVQQRATGLEVLGNFGMKWDKNSNTIKLFDTYDFPSVYTGKYKIPERKRPLRIREDIKLDPKQGSFLLRDNMKNYNTNEDKYYK